MTHTTSEGDVYFRTNTDSTETGYVRVTNVEVESDPDGEYPQGTVEVEQVLTGKEETVALARMEEFIEYGNIIEVDESVIEDTLGTVLDFAWREYTKLREVNGRGEYYAPIDQSLADVELALFALDSETLGEGGEEA